MPWWRVRGAVRLKSVSVVRHETMSRLHHVSANRMSSRWSRVWRNRYLLLLQSLRRKMFFKIHSFPNAHHVHLPSVAVFVRCRENPKEQVQRSVSAVNCKRLNKRLAMYLLGHNASPSNDTHLHTLCRPKAWPFIVATMLTQTIRECLAPCSHPSTKQRVQSTLLVLPSHPPLVPIPQISPCWGINIVPQRGVVPF